LPVVQNRVRDRSGKLKPLEERVLISLVNEVRVVHTRVGQGALHLLLGFAAVPRDPGVEGDADELGPSHGVLARQGRQVRKLLDARHAPSRPEVDEHRPAAEPCKDRVDPIEVRELDLRLRAGLAHSKA